MLRLTPKKLRHFVNWSLDTMDGLRVGWIEAYVGDFKKLVRFSFLKLLASFLGIFAANAQFSKSH